MKKFVLVYFGKTRPEDIAQEDMKSTMEKWITWFGSFKEQMVDGGNPFASTGKSVTAKGIESIPADMMSATGYTIINATDMDEATKIASSCPVLEDDSNGSVHVYEALPM